VLVGEARQRKLAGTYPADRERAEERRVRQRKQTGPKVKRSTRFVRRGARPGVPEGCGRGRDGSIQRMEKLGPQILKERRRELELAAAVRATRKA
jgi:hypothetical protein